MGCCSKNKYTEDLELDIDRYKGVNWEIEKLHYQIDKINSERILNLENQLRFLKVEMELLELKNIKLKGEINNMMLICDYKVNEKVFNEIKNGEASVNLENDVERDFCLNFFYSQGYKWLKAQPQCLRDTSYALRGKYIDHATPEVHESLGLYVYDIYDLFSIVPSNERFKLFHSKFESLCEASMELNIKYIKVLGNESLRAIGKSVYLNKLARENNAVVISRYEDNRDSKYSEFIRIYPVGENIEGEIRKLKSVKQDEKYIIDEGFSQEHIKEIVRYIGEENLILALI